MASEGNKRRSGKFFVNGGLVLGSWKTPLTRKALPCLYFRKTKSEEHIVRDLVRIHRPCDRGRRGGLMVSALDSGASAPGSSPGRGHCVVFLGKTLYSHGAPPHPGV